MKVAHFITVGRGRREPVGGGRRWIVHVFFEMLWWWNVACWGDVYKRCLCYHNLEIVMAQIISC